VGAAQDIAHDGVEQHWIGYQGEVMVLRAQKEASQSAT